MQFWLRKRSPPTVEPCQQCQHVRRCTSSKLLTHQAHIASKLLDAYQSYKMLPDKFITISFSHTSISLPSGHVYQETYQQLCLNIIFGALKLQWELPVNILSFGGKEIINFCKYDNKWKTRTVLLLVKTVARTKKQKHRRLAGFGRVTRSSLRQFSEYLWIWA